MKATSEYEKASLADAFNLLQTTTNGLTESEAQLRIEKVGYNEVVEKKKSPIVDFLSRYWGPMPWLLEFTILLSYFIHHYLEAAIILGLLTTNALIGFHHTRGSQKALDILKNKLAVKVKVLRSGRWTVKDAREIVPGDIIAIGLGDLVPADAKILEGEVSVDQSALTGESLPVTATESGIVYSSSTVKRGEARVLVVNTGANTYFGKTVELVKIAKPTSHQQQVMMAIVKYMMYVSIAALALVAGDAALSQTGPLTIVTFALIFLMGAVPVALPAVFAVVLSVGAMELATRGALVTRLDSIEDAASMDVLCLDKTGTITQNRLTVTDPVPFSIFKKDEVALFAYLASKAEARDIVDLTIIEYAQTLGPNLESYRQTSFTPFDPTTKRSEALVEHEKELFRVVKGAPQIVASLCREVDEKTRVEVNERVEELSRRGYRTLAVAKSDVGDLENLRLVGLLPLADPPRPDSSGMIEELRKLAVRTKMLTGDNVAIAREIARQVGIGDEIHRMADLARLNENEQARVIEESDGLAEIYPEDKYRIVKLLQSKNHLVGMTGDGTNDSPALKQAEVGIAVQNSTDVAKASASIVLTEPGTRVIIDAIKTSREIYQRMLTWVINKVTKVIQFVGILVLAFFWLHDVVLTVLGMVLLVFANDFVTMSLATDDVEHTSNPNIWNVRNVTSASLLIGALLVLEGAIAILIGTSYFHMDLTSLQTFVLLMLVFTSQVRVLIVRERKHCWSSRPGRELIISTVAAIIGFSFLGVYGIIIPPITLEQVVFVLVFSAAFTFGVDFPKYTVFQKFRL
jgi:H+-transporting ATPase